MDRGVYLALTGGISHDRKTEAIINNLAGSNVSGFKKNIPVFNVYAQAVSPIADGLSARVFVDIGDMFTDFSQGVVKTTGNPLDVAIFGHGFFVVDTPNGRMFTRKGDFTVAKDGKLVTKDGYAVEGNNGVIILTAGEVAIAQDGNISIDGNIIGKLKIVTFADPHQLQKAGNGLFMALQANVAELPSDASLMPSSLEMSNVSAVEEMVSMINAIRAYESNMKLIQGFDEIAEKSIRAASSR